MDWGSLSPRSAGRNDAAVERLATALAMPTLSRIAPTQGDAEAFLALRRHLEESFPLTHEILTREEIGDRYALLYTWRGTDTSAEPWLLSSHQDVVAAEPGARSHWTHPPFGGQVVDGYIWGRGALDLKVSLLGALEAVEHLLAQGFRPRRAIYLSFGADEEVGGKRGARKIAAHLRTQGIRLAFTLDEGGMVLSKTIPGVRRPVAFIGVAEKGELLLRLVAKGSSGHSSMPHSKSAVGRLARAIAAIEDGQMSPRLTPPLSDTFTWLAPYARRPYRDIYRRCRLFAPLLVRLLRHDPLANALVRTTLATTMVQAGESENVIPGTATAVVHARIKPGDSVGDVISHLHRLVAPYDVAVEVLEGREASRISSTDTPEFCALCETIHEVMPDVVVAPFLSLNATDSRHYQSFTRNQYRFVPAHIPAEDLQSIHGINERISVQNYHRAIEFFIAFIRNVDSKTPPPREH